MYINYSYLSKVQVSYFFWKAKNYIYYLVFHNYRPPLNMMTYNESFAAILKGFFIAAPINNELNRSSEKKLLIIFIYSHYHCLKSIYPP